MVVETRQSVHMTVKRVMQDTHLSECSSDVLESLASPSNTGAARVAEIYKEKNKAQPVERRVHVGSNRVARACKSRASKLIPIAAFPPKMTVACILGDEIRGCVCQ